MAKMPKQVPLKAPKVKAAPLPKPMKMPKAPKIETGLPSVLQPGKKNPVQKMKGKLGGGGTGSGNTGVML